MNTFDAMDQRLVDLRVKILALPRITDWDTLPMEAVGAGAWEWRPSSGTMRFSAAWCDLLGIERFNQSVPVKKYLQYVHPEDQTLVTITMVEFLLRRGQYVSRHRMVRRDGQERQILSRDVVVLFERGSPSLVIGADFDVTGVSC